MRKSLFFPMLALAVLAIVPACSGEDDEPVVPQASDPNVAVPDPEGTVTVNITNNGRDGEVYLSDLGVWIYIDEGNNFRLYYLSDYSASIVSLGAMKGLGNVVTVPTEGWSTSVAVVPGNGYVVRATRSYPIVETNYARLYVDSYMTSTSGGIMGATVKYQSPFVLPIVLSETDISFDASAGSREIGYTGSDFSVKSAPEWCSVRLSPDGSSLTVSVTENFSASEYTGDIVLSNQSGEATIKVTQAASPSPLFPAGRGTATDPFSITAPEHLDSVRVVADGGYVFSLDNDIDLSDYLSPQGNGWMPIGSSSEPFDGTFHGNMHTISGLWIYRLSTDYLGLFGYVGRDVAIDGIRLVLDEKGIVGTGDYVGGVCGGMDGGPVLGGYIIACSVDGTLKGRRYVGGIAGRGSHISQCYTAGDVTASYYLAGISMNSTVVDSYSKAVLSVAENREAYGITDYSAGYCFFAGKVINGKGVYPTDNYCYYDAETTGDEGGLPTSEMFRQATYVNWDFINVWQIDEGRSYPTLRCFDR